MRHYLLLIFLLTSLIVACGSSVESSEPDPDSIPPIDTTNHSVPLDEILFDTFRSYDRVVPLPEADPALINRLRDAIPPIFSPVFETADDAGWLSEKDLVLGYAEGGFAFAYPLKIMNWHEIVEHEIEVEGETRYILATY